LVFEDLVFYQCEGGVRFFIRLRSHEVSDQDTKQPLRAMPRLKLNR